MLDAAAKALKLSTQDLLTEAQRRQDDDRRASRGKQGIPLYDVTYRRWKPSATPTIQEHGEPSVPLFPQLQGWARSRATEGPGLPSGFGFGLGFGGGDSFATIAKALGITTQDLMTDLRNGQSIAAIAKTKSVDVTNLVNTLLTDATSKLNDAVKNKHLSQDMATKLEAHLKDMITARTG